jgi:chromosome partitioning protein
MGRSIAVVCPKGGVGKTTVAVNMAAAFAEKGFNCLLVGVDPQCGLIGSFGRDRFEIDNGLYDFFDPEGSPDQVVQPSGTPNLDFITSNIWSREEEQLLVDAAAADPFRLRRSLAPLRAHYDYIILDCPPNLGPLTAAALLAADGFLVPLQAEELAYLALPRLFDSLGSGSWGPGGPPELLGIVLNQVDPRTRMTHSIVGKVRAEHGERVLRTMIPRTVRLAEVAQRGKPVIRFNRSGSAAHAFSDLADELLARSAADVPERHPEPVATGAGGADEGLPAETLMAPPLPDEITRPVALHLDGGKSERLLSIEELSETESIGAALRSRPSLDDYDNDIDESDPL